MSSSCRQIRLCMRQKLPNEELKIGRMFVSPIGQSVLHDVIVDTVISLGKRLKIDVVAEGIETKQQLAYLISHGCVKFQGYCFSRPVSALEVQRNYVL